MDAKKLLVSVSGLARGGDLRKDGDVQCREQRRRAVPDVVMAATYGQAELHGRVWLDAVQRLDPGFFVHPQHDRVLGRETGVSLDPPASPRLSLAAARANQHSELGSRPAPQPRRVARRDSQPEEIPFSAVADRWGILWIKEAHPFDFVWTYRLDAFLYRAISASSNVAGE